MTIDGAAKDYLSLSRDVERVSDRVAGTLASLAEEAGRTRARSTDPFGAQRHVAGQSTYRTLVESEPSAHEVSLRDALLRWVHELLQARVGWDLTVDEADALHAKDERLPARARAMDAAGATVPRTFLEASRALVSEPTAARAALALERLAELAPPLAAVRRERRARRFEVARRLGLAHPWSLAIRTELAEISARARELLDATEPLTEDLRRRAQRTSGSERAWSSSDAIHHALARDAQEGWPAHLGARWLEDVFSALAQRPFRPPVLPAPLGGASFLRAAAAWGRALRLSGTARSLPFVLARDPYPIDAYRFGAVLSVAVADPVFQKKKLGLSARSAAAQARALRGSLLFALRTHAVRWLLASAESVDGGTFEELTARAFGAPLPASMRDAWPDPRADEPARILGALEADAFARDLVERFDEDWFANPRTGAHFAAIAAGPVWTGDAPLRSSPAETARAFERALG